MGVQSKLVFYLIPILLLIAVIMVFFSGGGLWEDTKEIAIGAKDIIYESVDFGTESLSANVSISADLREEIERMVSSINSMKGKEHCFVNFGTLSDLEERGVSISFEKTTEGTMLTIMRGGGTQIVTDMMQTIEGMEPCVIAGNTQGPAKNFESYYFNNGETLSDIHYSNVPSLSIVYTDGGAWRYAANVIQVPFLGIDRGNNFKSEGWMYTPDGKNFCFFPTVGDYEEGLDDKYFESGEGTIVGLINGVDSKIKSCE